TEDFFDRILLAEAVAAQDLKRVAGDLECRLRAEGLRGNRVFHRGYGRVGVVGYRGAREQAACLDLGEHFEQVLLHELMLANRLATLDAIPGVIERDLEGRTSHSGEDRTHHRIRTTASALGRRSRGLVGRDQHVAARNPDLIEKNLALVERALAELVERLALRYAGQVKRHESNAAAEHDAA